MKHPRTTALFWTTVLLLGSLLWFGERQSWTLPSPLLRTSNHRLGHEMDTITITTTASPLAGYYSDPNHPHCPRIIQVAASFVSVAGRDGSPGCTADDGGSAGAPWTVPGRIEPATRSRRFWSSSSEHHPIITLYVDFSSKGGPAHLVGVYHKTATSPAAMIQWDDGNTWTQLAPLTTTDHPRGPVVLPTARPS